MFTNKDENPSIQCTVSDCKYHADSSDYCSLETIRVSKCEHTSKSSCDTECDSFIAKEDKFF